MNVQELIERLKAERKSLDSDIGESDGSIYFHYPRKGWQRISR